MPTYHINDHALHVELSGPPDGPAVVLLHHGLGSLRAWRAQMPALTQAGYRVIAYDRWGYGDSDPRPALDLPHFSADEADLAGLLEALEIDTLHLVGHSDGGTLALYFAAHQPERIRSLTVVAAHIYVEPKMAPGIDGVRVIFEQDERFRAGLQRVHGSKYQQVFENWYRAWRAEANLLWDMRPLLKTITCPAWVVQGEDDEHATPRHARDLAAALPNASLWLAPGAAHMLPQERAGEFNARLLAFLARVDSDIRLGKEPHVQ